MNEEELNPEQQAARDEVHDLLQRHSTLLGPWQEIDEIEAPTDHVYLAGWVLMASWTDSDGKSYLTRIPSKNLVAHHRVGLLHEGLYGFGDD